MPVDMHKRKQPCSLPGALPCVCLLTLTFGYRFLVHGSVKGASSSRGYTATSLNTPLSVSCTRSGKTANSLLPSNTMTSELQCRHTCRYATKDARGISRTLLTTPRQASKGKNNRKQLSAWHALSMLHFKWSNCKAIKQLGKPRAYGVHAVAGG